MKTTKIAAVSSLVVTFFVTVPRAAVAEATAVLHVDVDRSAVVEQETAAGWKSVCIAPCDQPLPRDGTYRVTGSALKTSSTFRLHPDARGRASVRVDARSDTLLPAGLFITGTGVAMLLGGVWSFIEAIGCRARESGGLLARDADSPPSGRCADNGAIFIGAGLAITTVGVMLTVLGARPSRVRDMPARTPEWRTPSGPQPTTHAPTLQLPVVTGTF